MDENPIVPQDATNLEEELELEIPVETEDVEALRAQIAEKDTFARQAVARAKKAEEELKALKTPKPAPVPQSSNPASSLVDIDERILKSQGVNDELLKDIKKVAQVTGLSLIDAQNDPYIVARKSELEKEKKQREASLPASRGSGQPKVKKDFNTPGLTREEHQKLIESLS